MVRGAVIIANLEPYPAMQDSRVEWPGGGGGTYGTGPVGPAGFTEAGVGSPAVAL